MAWIEGLSSSNRLLQDLAKILTQANKDVGGNVDPAKNWELVYPRPFNLTDTKGESMTQKTGAGIAANSYGGTKSPWFEFVKPVVYSTSAGTTTKVDAATYTVNYKDGYVTFSAPPTGTLTVDYTYKSDESLATAFSKIGPSGRIVLKTTTTPVTPDTSSDPFNTDPDLKIEKLSMFVEIEKPKLVINPETGQTATKFNSNQTVENHYYMNVRMFDRYDYQKQLPLEKTVDEITGLTTDEGAHVSPWSKFAWYQDFKEFLVDELDEDPGTDDLADGIVFTYLETPGLYGEVPIQYWISINNDRLAMILMGEPTINYDNYLTSFGYFGKIDSFEGSKNDTAGNFAISVGSSTIPAEAKPNLDPITEKVLFSAAPIQPTKGTTYSTFQHTVSYKVVAVNDSGISMPSDEAIASYIYGWNSGGSNENTAFNNFKLTFSHIPANANSVRIYRKLVSGVATGGKDDWYLEAEIPKDTATSTGYVGQMTADLEQPCPVSNFNAEEAGVVRDSITGAVLQVKFPKVWGDNTATGVNDISMYKTRSGVYYQRHQVSFNTPEPFMKKDAFNPSRYTGKFHLSPAYVVHGYDGYRGWLKDVVVVDDSSIVHLDELIVDKGKSTEKTYKYFRVSAPFSLMTSSANANYGIGILKV